MKEGLHQHYVLGNDIDARVTATWESPRGIGFEPIGQNPSASGGTAFTGRFDGGNFTIDGLYVDLRGVSDADNAGREVGLFGYTHRAAIANVGLTNVEIHGQAAAGALVGFNADSSINSSYSSGTVSGGRDVGGLVGSLGNSGGITNSYSTGQVTAPSAADFVGGLLGRLEPSGGTVTRSHWDADPSKQWGSAGGLGAQGRITAAMQSQGIYSGWDFGGTWQIAPNQYPELQGNPRPN